eukprot:scaffold31388_cov18-Prasinocladus_malaysianus.AAC.1
MAVDVPLGFVCSHDEDGQRLVLELLPEDFSLRTPGLSSVGRLDKMASGLLLLTQSGPLVHALTSPSRHLPKVRSYIYLHQRQPLAGCASTTMGWLRC